MRSTYIWILLLFSLNSFGQQFGERRSNAQKGQDKITQLKIAKLTSDMQMTKSQAQKFWPVYNDFDAKRRDIRRQIRQLSKNISEDDDAYKKQQRILDLKQNELDLTRTYKASFLRVITEQQYGIMLTSEERFNQVLLERLKDRQND